MLLTIPRKKGEKLNLEKPVNGYLYTHYDEDTINKATEPLKNLTKLRLAAINNIDKNESLSTEVVKYSFCFAHFFKAMSL